MSQASYEKRVEVSDDGGATWHLLPHTSCSLDFSGDTLDDTSGGNAGYRSRVLGLHDWSVSGEFLWTAANDGLTAARDAKLNRTDLKIRYLPDGTTPNGFQGDVVVESYNQSGDISSLETVSITFQAAGALAAA